MVYIEHIDQNLGVVVEHLSLDRKMELDVVVSEFPELNLFEVNFNPEIRHVHVSKLNIPCDCVSASVGNILEGVKQFFCPKLKQLSVIVQSLASLGQKLFQGFSLFDLEKVKIVFFVSSIVVIEAQVAREVFGLQKLLASSNLIVELIQDVIIWETTRNLVALHWEVFVSTIGDHFAHACVVLLEHLYSLFPVVDRPNLTI